MFSAIFLHIIIILMSCNVTEYLYSTPSRYLLTDCAIILLIIILILEIVMSRAQGSTSGSTVALYHSQALIKEEGWWQGPDTATVKNG